MKEENASSSKGAAPSKGATPSAASKAAPAPATGPVTEEEIKAVLQQRTPVTTQDLVAKFKSRLKTKEVMNFVFLPLFFNSGYFFLMFLPSGQIRTVVATLNVL